LRIDRKQPETTVLKQQEMSSTPAIPLDNETHIRGVSLSAEDVLSLTSLEEDGHNTKSNSNHNSETILDCNPGIEDDVDAYAYESVESKIEEAQQGNVGNIQATHNEKEFNASSEEANDIPIAHCQVEAISAAPISGIAEVPSVSRGAVPLSNENQTLITTTESVLSTTSSSLSQGKERQRKPLPLNYEILPGLWAQLNHDAKVEIAPITNEINGEIDYININIHAKDTLLGDCFFIGKNVRLQAKLHKSASIITDLVVSIDHLELDPLVNRKQVVRFLEHFCKNKDENNCNHSQKSGKNHDEESLPRRRLTRAEWEQLLKNAKNDCRQHDPISSSEEALISNYEASIENGNNNVLQSNDTLPVVIASSAPIPFDQKCPYVNIRAVKCDISFRDSSSHGMFNSSIKFPDCEGSAECTLRTLLKYYCHSILYEIDILNGNRAGIDAKTVTSDITSVGGGALGASAGAALLGPVGFVAGSYIGSRAGRKHSASIVTATAGAAAFGPVGLIVGACCATPMNDDDDTETNDRHVIKKSKSVKIDDFGNKKTDLGRAASEHLHSKKYEIAGSTGVAAGAIVGSVLLGPVGWLAGAAVGSVSGRKIVEKATSAVACGKKARGSDPETESYRFGDFTRGLFHGAP